AAAGEDPPQRTRAPERLLALHRVAAADARGVRAAGEDAGPRGGVARAAVGTRVAGLRPARLGALVRRAHGRPQVHRLADRRRNPGAQRRGGRARGGLGRPRPAPGRPARVPRTGGDGHPPPAGRERGRVGRTQRQAGRPVRLGRRGVAAPRGPPSRGAGGARRGARPCARTIARGNGRNPALPHPAPQSRPLPARRPGRVPPAGRARAAGVGAAEPEEAHPLGAGGDAGVRPRASPRRLRGRDPDAHSARGGHRARGALLLRSTAHPSRRGAAGKRWRRRVPGGRGPHRAGGGGAAGALRREVGEDAARAARALAGRGADRGDGDVGDAARDGRGRAVLRPPHRRAAVRALRRRHGSCPRKWV
ncbi:MAG: hypothetical protein AVDCRST_MAG91-288, partial [uncultured Sphingomonadaceae bacterium]